MATIDPLLQRQFAVEVVRQLRDAGHEAYWAGGCVRDALLGQRPKDYDVATAARPEQVRELFGRRKTLAIGAAFGIIGVLGPQGAGQVEVATFRSDVSYTDGRRPDAIVYSDARHDAQRRDFTINGVFFDPLQERELDFVGGVADLRQGIVRAIGDPRERFAEDKLRLLRAVRFAARFGFRLDPATADAIREMAAEIAVVSAERIAQEMRAILVDAQRAAAVELLRELGLLASILPELASLAAGSSADDSDADWPRTLRVVAALEGPSFPLALATLLAETHEAGARVVGRRWRLSNDETERADWLLRHRDALAGAASLPWSRLQPLLVHPGAAELIALHEARGLAGAAEDAAYCRAKLRLPAQELDPPPLLTGDDLIALRLPRGPLYKSILDAVRAAQLDGQAATPAEALDLARRLASENGASEG